MQLFEIFRSFTGQRYLHYIILLIYNILCRKIVLVCVGLCWSLLVALVCWSGYSFQIILFFFFFLENWRKTPQYEKFICCFQSKRISRLWQIARGLSPCGHHRFCRKRQVKIGHGVFDQVGISGILPALHCFTKPDLGVPDPVHCRTKGVCPRHHVAPGRTSLINCHSP